MFFPTTTPIFPFYTCPNDDFYYSPDLQPATTPSTLALYNMTRVLALSLLFFTVLRLSARRAPLSALIGLSLIAGGFLYDVGFGLPGVDAAALVVATTSTTTSIPAPSTKTNFFESVCDSTASGRTRSSALWLLSLALTVLVLLGLITGHLRRSLPGFSSLVTTYRPLAGRLAARSGSDKPVGWGDDYPVGINTSLEARSEPFPAWMHLPGTLLVLALLALLTPMAFAESSQGVKKVGRSAAVREDDVSPIWITYYSTTTIWLPVVMVTAPPTSGLSSTPTRSIEGVAGTGGLSVPRSGLGCTEVEQAVCPIVEGRKTRVLPRVMASA